MSAEASSWALKQDAGGPGPKLLLLVLANHAGKDGVTFVGRRRLADECCCREATITANMAKLEQAKLIHRFERRRPNGSRTSDWTVLAPGAPDRSPMVSADPAEYVGVKGFDGLTASGADFESGAVSVPGQVRNSGGPEQSGESSVPEGGVTPLTPELAVADPLCVVWNTYLDLVVKPNRMRRRLDAAHRRMIQAALKVRPVDECVAAVVGLSKSPHHNGKNNRKKKYLDLRYALRGNAQSGQTIEDRIDMMAEMAGDTPDRERFRKKGDGSEQL